MVAATCKYDLIFEKLERPRKSVVLGGDVVRAHRSDCPLCRRRGAPLKTAELPNGGVLVKCQACGAGMFEFAAFHGLSAMDFAPTEFANPATERAGGAAHKKRPAQWHSLFEALDEIEHLLMECVETRDTTLETLWTALDFVSKARAQARAAVRTAKEKSRETRAAA